MPLSRVCSLAWVLGNVTGSSSGGTAAGIHTQRKDSQTQQREAEASCTPEPCVNLIGSLPLLTLPYSRKRKNMISHRSQDLWDKPEVPMVA